MNRTLIIGGRDIVINTLGNTIDLAFDKLHAAYFGNALLAWEEFEAAAIDYFTNNPTPAANDDYFTNFTVIWRMLLDNGRYEQAEHLWQRALQPALAWESTHPNQHIHKGTPYYFWSMTVLLGGDIDKGYLLAHQALDEDRQTSGHATPDAPAYGLVSLNYTKGEQAFRQWVLAQAHFLDTLLTNYNATHGRALTLDEVKRRFFDAPPDTDTIFLLTYTIARLMRLRAVPEQTTKNSFAGQLQLNLLFDIALVIDASIKKKSNDQHFREQAAHLLNAAGHPLNIQQLGDINGLFKANFDATLLAALDATLPSATLDRLQCDVALAYGLRNNGAHNTSSVTTIWQHFTDVQQALFRVLFASIDHLY